jgi:alpha-galactosidase
VANYSCLKPVILDGDLYRLVSPYSGEHSAVM